MIRTKLVPITMTLMLAACGTNPHDRAISGGGIGAAGGAILGAVTGLTVLQGALIGTGVGAALGGLTTADTFNLGEPFWRRSGGERTAASSTASTSRSSAYSESVARTQRDLKRAGYDPGPIDGVLGPKTRAAIARYENEKGGKLGAKTGGAGSADKVASKAAAAQLN